MRLSAAVVAAVLAVGCCRSRDRGHAAPAPASSPADSASAAPVSASISAPPPPPPAGSAELALLAPLVAGKTIGGFTVRAIHAVQRGRLRVVCAKDRAVIGLDVALVDDAEGAPIPPATAGRYAIFYTLRDATPEDAERLARMLARVLERNASVPTPPGLEPFKPDPKPGILL